MQSEIFNDMGRKEDKNYSKTFFDTDVRMLLVSSRVCVCARVCLLL